MKYSVSMVLLNLIMPAFAAQTSNTSFFCDHLYEKHQKAAKKTVTLLQSANCAPDKKVGDCLAVYRSIVQLLEPYSNDTTIGTVQEEELRRLHQFAVLHVTQDQAYKLKMRELVKWLSGVDRLVQKFMECGFNVQQLFYADTYEYDKLLLDVMGQRHRIGRVTGEIKKLMLPFAVRKSAQLLGHSIVYKQKGLASLTEPGMSIADCKAISSTLERLIKESASDEDTKGLVYGYKSWLERLQQSSSDSESQEIVQECVNKLCKNILPKVRGHNEHRVAFTAAFKAINEADTVLHELLTTVVQTLSQRMGSELLLDQKYTELLVDMFTANGAAAVPVAIVLAFDKAALHVALGLQAIQMDIERRIKYILTSPSVRREKEQALKIEAQIRGV
jgi:hypothetical protein